MECTFLTPEANEMVAAANEYEKAKERVFLAISDYYGESSEEHLMATDWYVAADKQLAPLLGALLLREISNPNSIKVV